MTWVRIKSQKLTNWATQGPQIFIFMFINLYPIYMLRFFCIKRRWSNVIFCNIYSKMTFTREHWCWCFSEGWVLEGQAEQPALPGTGLRLATAAVAHLLSLPFFFFFCTCQGFSLVFVHFSCHWRSWRMQGVFAFWHVGEKMSAWGQMRRKWLVVLLALESCLAHSIYLVAHVDSEVLEVSSSTCGGGVVVVVKMRLAGWIRKCLGSKDTPNIQGLSLSGFSSVLSRKPVWFLSSCWPVPRMLTEWLMFPTSCPYSRERELLAFGKHKAYLYGKPPKQHWFDTFLLQWYLVNFLLVWL